MKLPHFVGGSAILLMGWLAATFFRDVPPQRYQKSDKFPATVSNGALVPSPATGVFQVSNSH